MSFLVSLSPVSATFSALTTMTKSPMSMCGAKVGLCLPRSRFAAWTASLPRMTSEASMTCHSRWMSPGFGLYVRTCVCLYSFVWTRQVVPAGVLRPTVSGRSGWCRGF